MRRFTFLALGLTAIAALALPAGSCNPPSAGRLRVRDGFFVDASGDAVFLRGLCYSHRTKTVPHAAWQREEHFARIRSWGFNLVRYVVLWEAIEPQRDQIDTAYLDAVERALQWARNQGLYVILDMHQDAYAAHFGGDGMPFWTIKPGHQGPYTPLRPWWLNYASWPVIDSFNNFWFSSDLRREYRDAWVELARRARNHPNVIGYDLMNEPQAVSPLPQWFEATVLSGFYRELTQALSAEDPEALIFCEPMAFVGNNGLPSAVRKPSDQAIYSPHYYDVVVHSGLPYDQGKYRVKAALAIHQSIAKAWNSAVFLGEFSTLNTGYGYLDAARHHVEAMDEALIPAWAWWDYNPEAATNTTAEPDLFSVVDPAGQERPVLDHLARPYPALLRGTARKLSFKYSTRRFELEWRGQAGTSRVRIPARHYPSGMAVQLTRAPETPQEILVARIAGQRPSAGTWTWDGVAQELVIDVAGAGRDHEVRLVVRPQ